MFCFLFVFDPFVHSCFLFIYWVVDTLPGAHPVRPRADGVRDEFVPPIVWFICRRGDKGTYFHERIPCPLIFVFLSKLYLISLSRSFSCGLLRYWRNCKF